MTTPTFSGFTFGNKGFGDASFNLTDPSSNSSGAFTIVSLNPDIISVSGYVATILKNGTATIRASQAGNGIYRSGFIDAVITVTPQLSPALSNFPAINTQYGSDPFMITSPFSLSMGFFAFDSSDSTIASIDGNNIVINGVGSTTIIAIQDESGNYMSERISTTITVSKGIPNLRDFTLPVIKMGSTHRFEAPKSNSAGTFFYESSDTNVANATNTNVLFNGWNDNSVVGINIGTTNIIARQRETRFFLRNTISTLLTVEARTLPTISIKPTANQPLSAVAFPFVNAVVTMISNTNAPTAGVAQFSSVLIDGTQWSVFYPATQ